ncbi:unnamed protein product [Sphenostylis stenocarpa]|uniref:Uncharacterized protein n=1 Tax=Sphenostylis stenocarpa TaxID=92480 RepID=A0AA86T2W7_9FABA|nr:unnamed protein product [Sphenostylis stenocarpa]
MKELINKSFGRFMISRQQSCNHLLTAFTPPDSFAVLYCTIAAEAAAADMETVIRKGYMGGFLKEREKMVGAQRARKSRKERLIFPHKLSATETDPSEPTRSKITPKIHPTNK